MPSFGKLRITKRGILTFRWLPPATIDPDFELHARDLPIDSNSGSGVLVVPFTRISGVSAAGQLGSLAVDIPYTSGTITLEAVSATTGAAEISLESSDASYDKLLEDGSSWLLETDDHWEIEHLEYRLQEDGSSWLLETGDHWLTEHGISYIGPFLLMENGGYWLFQDGISRWKLENG